MVCDPATLATGGDTMEVPRTVMVASDWVNAPERNRPYHIRLCVPGYGGAFVFC